MRFQIGHIVIAVAIALRPAQADTVDDAGVVQLIRDNRILLTQQGFEQAAVGIETGGVEDGILGAQKVAYCLLQLLVQGLGAADKPHRGHAITPLLQALRGGRIDLRVLGQAQVVVGAQVENSPRRTPTWAPWAW